MEGGINHYVRWMTDRLEQCHRVLKPNASLYLHCDWHACHYLKVALDRIFGGTKCFKSQIIWQRAKSHNDPKQYGHIHDVILFYTKGQKYIWNQQYRPYDEEYISKTYSKIDKNGRRFKTSDLSAAKPGGDVEYEWKGVKPPKGRYWAYSKANMEKFEKERRLYYSKSGVPYLKNYLDEMKGIPLQDLWTDIPALGSGSKERLGYPTQKPLTLLERIISVSSNKGNIVLDPFCGCGTTLVAAHRLGRKYIGIDVSRTACKLMERRMRSEGASPAMIFGELTEKQLKKFPPFEFQNWVCEKLGGRVRQRKTGDMGIDGWTLDMIPIQVKQSERVGRNPIDNFQTAIRRVNKKKGIFVAFSFGKGAYEEVARAKNDGIEIELIRVEELLKKT